MGAMPTFEVELARDFVQFQDAAEMRGEMLDIAAVETLTGLDEVQVVLLELPSLHRFFLCIFLAIL